MSVLDVLQESMDDWRGNHVGDPLGYVAGVTLKGDAHDFAVLHDRTATVTRVDLRADLHREMRIDPGMRVEIEIDARNDAGGDRHPLPPDRITVSGNG